MMHADFVNCHDAGMPQRRRRGRLDPKAFRRIGRQAIRLIEAGNEANRASFDARGAMELEVYQQMVDMHAQTELIEETYDAAGDLVARTDRPFDLTFVMRRATGARWLNVAVLPAGAGRAAG